MLKGIFRIFPFRLEGGEAQVSRETSRPSLHNGYMNTNPVLAHYPTIQHAQEELYYDLHRHPELSMNEVRTRG